MAGTGYPMCLPRTAPAALGVSTDGLCPEENRPIQAILGDGTIEYAPETTTNNRTNVAFPVVPGFPDSTKQAPLEVGDYVTYAGTLVQDCPACTGGDSTAGPWPAGGASSTWVSARTIVNNVAVYTFHGSDPAYVETDVFILGTGGLTVLGAGEAAVRTPVRGDDDRRYPSASSAADSPLWHRPRRPGQRDRPRLGDHRRGSRPAQRGREGTLALPSAVRAIWNRSHEAGQAVRHELGRYVPSGDAGDAVGDRRAAVAESVQSWRPHFCKRALLRAVPRADPRVHLPGEHPGLADRGEQLQRHAVPGLRRVQFLGHRHPSHVIRAGHRAAQSVA